MDTRKLHTLVLGAGPAGLAAGYTLAAQGHSTVVLDRDKQPGGLMRSVRRGGFSVDVGRKELYNRLERVDAFWGQLLGDDYRPYPHRGGYLYEGHILEMSRVPKGFMRGMPLSMFAGCVAGFAAARLNPFAAKPRTVEEYFYRTRGRLLTRIASQGFQEKLAGRKWSEMLLAPNAQTDEASVFSTLQAGLSRAMSTTEVNTFKGRWRHPARGTGQICDAMATGIERAGGTFALGSKLLGIETQGNRVVSVSAEVNGEQVRYEPEHVASSIPLEAAIPLLGKEVPAAYKAAAGSPARRRTVVLVYLFLDRPPLFPHAWLQVTCPTTRIGRITNYEGFNGDMVPAGQGCLCCEYYCYGDDPLLKATDAELVRDTEDYCRRANLIDGKTRASDTFVLRLPGADASQNRHNWMTSLRLGLLTEIGQVGNFYHIGRTDLDIATLAGLEAADAIVSGDRRAFDRHFDPEEIGIRSERKAFEFTLPPVANN